MVKTRCVQTQCERAWPNQGELLRSSYRQCYLSQLPFFLVSTEEFIYKGHIYTWDVLGPLELCACPVPCSLNVEYLPWVLTKPGGRPADWLFQQVVQSFPRSKSIPVGRYSLMIRPVWSP